MASTSYTFLGASNLYNPGQSFPINDDFQRQLIMQQTMQPAQQESSSMLSSLENLRGGGMGTPGLQAVAPNHFGQVRELRKKFKEYTKEEFRHISNSPIVKHILIGMTKLNKDQIAERIKEHLENV